MELQTKESHLLLLAYLIGEIPTWRRLTSARLSDVCTAQLFSAVHQTRGPVHAQGSQFGHSQLEPWGQPVYSLPATCTLLLDYGVTALISKCLHSKHLLTGVWEFKMLLRFPPGSCGCAGTSTPLIRSRSPRPREADQREISQLALRDWVPRCEGPGGHNWGQPTLLRSTPRLQSAGNQRPLSLKHKELNPENTQRPQKESLTLRKDCSFSHHQVSDCGTMGRVASLKELYK